MTELKDFPKLESPFERGEVKNIYVCLPKFKKEFSWILDKDKVIATEKFHGTNVSVYVEDSIIKKVLNRTNYIDIWRTSPHFYLGIKRAIREKKFNLDLTKDGQYFGELLGEKINKNFHEVEEPLWIPFEYIKKHYSFRFYYDFLEGLDMSTDESIYTGFSDLFMNLKSLWFRQKGIDKSPEGIVFYDKETGEMCKLRRDMFDWYKGMRHKE